MCRAVTCKECGKTTWAGCGQHIDSVMRNVPKAQQCPGHTAPTTTTPRRRFLSRIFTRLHIPIDLPHADRSEHPTTPHPYAPRSAPPRAKHRQRSGPAAG